MYEINIADKKMLREMVREAMEKGETVRKLA